MALKAIYIPYLLRFKKPGGTLRGILTEKQTYFIKVYDDSDISRFGLGEAALFKGLSADDRPDYENKLTDVCKNIERYIDCPEGLQEWPSIRFGLESALLDWEGGGRRILYSSRFTQGQEGIRINGLIWMGSKDFMKEQIREKLSHGFRCIKLKIGAIDFDTELSLLKAIRNEFSPQEVELRVDANGAFTPDDALFKLDALSRLSIHSIEQPIRAGQWERMSELCENTPLPIALDEELIGVFNQKDKILMLKSISPQYIILKPALVGGISGSEEWICLAEERRIGWWITSALESNVGLNAIAQWCYTKSPVMPQGLGTGQLFTNNVSSPLRIWQESLWYDPLCEWDMSSFIEAK
ncbi:MAG: o-succinylbenzoate synthase [Bacteroidaceae bacterium]|nr:o-succinylbenzoate synthase [Bacteroidaceae bacterium]